MIKFKDSDKLGLVADVIQMQCFGVDDIKEMYDLRLAGGSDKFSQLCAIKFRSKLQNHDYPTFILAFVPKLRNKKYHSEQKSQALWYIYKVISYGQFDVLTPEQLFVNYGFDINEFFDSDIFAVIKRRFIQTIDIGLTQKFEKFFSTLTSTLEKDEALKLKESIESALEILKHNAQETNEKYFKLYSRILSDSELDEKIEQELIRQGIYADLKNVSDNDIEEINEASFNFDKYNQEQGSITGNGLLQLISDTETWNSLTSPIKIYDRASDKYYNIVDAHIVRGNNGLALEIDSFK